MKYKVVIAYEEGVAMYIEAKTKAQAEKKAMQVVGDYGQAIRDNEAENETVHRDYFVTDSKRI